MDKICYTDKSVLPDWKNMAAVRRLTGELQQTMECRTQKRDGD